MRAETEIVLDAGDSNLVDADNRVGAFIFPTLLRCDRPEIATCVHDLEVFGPVATLLPYSETRQAFDLVRRGQGSLVASLFSADTDFLGEAAKELAHTHGRILAIDASVTKTQTGHGNVMPMCLHGGPGRAGGGEELGGLRALLFYHRRTALQGPLAMLKSIVSSAVAFNPLSLVQLMTLEEFKSLLAPVTNLIGGRTLDDSLQSDLNARFPASGPEFAAILHGCQVAIKDGWMCKHEAAGIRYGRVIKPSPDLNELSVDVVDMSDLKGPHHRHPNGEVDLIMPLSADAEFDGHRAGWLVYAPGSAHYPTVTQGRALVLYLLPKGAIEFTRM